MQPPLVRENSVQRKGTQKSTGCVLSHWLCCNFILQRMCPQHEGIEESSEFSRLGIDHFFFWTQFEFVREQSVFLRVARPWSAKFAGFFDSASKNNLIQQHFVREWESCLKDQYGSKKGKSGDKMLRSEKIPSGGGRRQTCIQCHFSRSS